MDITQANWILAHPLWSNSCILPDGRLNKKRAEYYVKVAKMCGATMFRILPGLLIDTIIFPNWTVTDMRQYNYLPWEFNTQVWKFDLSRRNKIYHDNLTALCGILKSYDMGIVMSLYDRCHWAQWEKLKGGKLIEGRVPHSPFHLNVNGVDDMFTRSKWHDDYEQDIIKTLINSGCRFWLEFCNEPRVDARTYIAFTKPIYATCKLAGIKQNQLVSGIEWFLNGQVSEDYKSWRHSLGFTDSFEGGKKDADVGYAVAHGFPEDFLENNDLIDAAKHSRRFLVSTDGKILTAHELEKNLILYRKHEKQGRLKKWAYEALYQGDGTDLYVCAGISKAFCRKVNINYSLVDPGNSEDEPNPPTPTPPGPPAPPPPAMPNPRKKFKLSWRFYVGAAVLIGGSLMVTIGEPWPLWLMREVGLLLPFLAAYTKAIRQNKIEI